MKVAALFGFALLACATRGSTWVNEPLGGVDDEEPGKVVPPETGKSAERQEERYRTRVIGGPAARPETRAARVQGEVMQGRVLGTFRNTYYDFPSEGDFSGPLTALHDSTCNVIERVPQGFFESVCVQGSGLLQSGGTVSFAKRDCACATVCPRTQQKICFDRLDARSYPWGRGALGKPITPLLTVAVDDSIIPMETPVYIPEYDGVPRDRDGSEVHDGCFVAQDRGVRVIGKHVDVFTGHQSITTLWNHLVPSNEGVTVVVESPRCTPEHIRLRGAQ